MVTIGMQNRPVRAALDLPVVECDRRLWTPAGSWPACGYAPEFEMRRPNLTRASMTLSSDDGLVRGGP